jgi:polar amino acid transport system substrate-binding protein
MRKLILLAGVLLAAGLGAGCGGDDEGSGQDTTQGGQAALSTVQEGTLTVGSDIPFPPFEFREGNRLTGFDVEIVEEIGRRLNLKVKWVDTAFDTIFTQLAAGRFDMVASATTITPERERQVKFTEPYYAAQQALTINRRRSPNVRTVQDLKAGDVVAVQKGTTGEVWVRDNVPEGVNVRSFPEGPDTYTALEAGSVEGVVFDEPSAVDEAKKRKSLAVVQKIDTGERYGLGVDPRNPELLKAANDALADMKRDGAYKRIYDRFDLPEGGNILEAGA